MNLRLLQIADSALPIGGYAHSWGLEAAIQKGLVHDTVSLDRWVRCWFRHSLGPLEGVVVGAACRATSLQDWRVLVQANELLTASIAPPSIRAVSREMGDLLLRLALTWPWSAGALEDIEAAVIALSDQNRWHHAVVFGMLGAIAGGSPAETLMAYLHQALAAMIGAGVRAIPVGHTHGQQILAYLHEDVVQLAGALWDRDLATAGSGCPFYEVLCDQQTRLYSRLFRS